MGKATVFAAAAGGFVLGLVFCFTDAGNSLLAGLRGDPRPTPATPPHLIYEEPPPGHPAAQYQPAITPIEQPPPFEATRQQQVRDDAKIQAEELLDEAERRRSQ